MGPRVSRFYHATPHQDCLQKAMSVRQGHVHYGKHICAGCAALHLDQFKQMAPKNTRIIIQNEIANETYFEPVIIIATKISNTTFYAVYWMFVSELIDVHSVEVVGNVIISPSNGRMDAGIACSGGFINVTFHAVPEARFTWRDDPTLLTLAEYQQKWMENSTVHKGSTIEIDKNIGVMLV